MNEYKENIKAYVQAKKDEFSILNDYNTRVVSFGFAAFFAMAIYVKNFAPKQLFIMAILFMSASVALFVGFELFRAVELNLNAAKKSRAFEGLPEDSPMRQINDEELITYVRLQKWNPWFLFPSLFCGLVGMGILFVCYVSALIS